VGESQYLQFIVNVVPSDVYSGLVESMTMSVEEIVPAACYRSTDVSTKSRTVPPSSGKGIRLGDSLQAVMLAYGQPIDIRKVGPRTALRYESELDGDRFTEWLLSFHKDRLVKWTVRSFPFFIEVGS
jgi:hypothetical protein